jgi:Fe-S-cluster containining protein
MSYEIARKTCRFDVCSKCETICCQEAKPPLTVRRKKIITKFLKEQGIPVENKFVAEAYCFPAVDEEGFCVFYCKNSGKCSIHSVKPETCIAGPITFDINLQTGKIEWFLKTAEVCSLAKELYKNPDSLKEHFQVAKIEILQLVHELDPVALRAIMKVEEPQTVKIGENDLPPKVARKLDSGQ